MQHYTQKLIPDATYHVYNRANGNEKLFRTPDNYRFFISKYNQYISGIADTWCYCLMPNHFHFLIRVKGEKELSKHFCEENLHQKAIETLLWRQFSNFFNSYSKAFNKEHNRKGNLFMRTFKRKRIDDLQYFNNLIFYIHCNPIAADITNNLKEYNYSSYLKIISDETSFVKKQEVLEHFGGLENFIHFHQSKLDPFELSFN